MPEPPPSHRLEGWSVRGWAGVGLAGALYALAFVGVAVAAALFAIYYRTPARPVPQVFPAPQLNGRIDSDPSWSFAPTRSAPEGIEAAMRTLAARGDSAWDAGAEPGTRGQIPPEGPRR